MWLAASMVGGIIQLLRRKHAYAYVKRPPSVQPRYSTKASSRCTLPACPMIAPLIIPSRYWCVLSHALQPFWITLTVGMFGEWHQNYTTVQAWLNFHGIYSTQCLHEHPILSISANTIVWARSLSVKCSTSLNARPVYLGLATVGFCWVQK